MPAKVSTFILTFINQTIEISDELFSIIQEYNDKLELLDLSRDKYLFPKLNLYSNIVKEHTTTDNIVVLSQFSTLLEKFHDNIALGIYGYNLPRIINPGDTRHLAIINMFLQGYNALTMKRLAHYEDMTSSTNYYDHAKFYVSSYIKRLASSKTSEAISMLIGGTLMPVEARKHYYK